MYLHITIKRSNVVLLYSPTFYSISIELADQAIALLGDLRCLSCQGCAHSSLRFVVNLLDYVEGLVLCVVLLRRTTTRVILLRKMMLILLLLLLLSLGILYHDRGR
jgi:hypothetical protein